MFALNEPNFELENYSQSYAYFLEEMYSKLGNGATNFESLHNKLVSPKKSIKLFSDHDLSAMHYCLNIMAGRGAWSGNGG